MQFTTATVFAILAAAAEAATLTNSAYSGIGEGKSFTFTWGNASGPVTLTLKQGEPNALRTVQEITSGQTGGSFTWTPETGKLPAGQYAIEIKDGSGLNYSPQFPFAGTGSASSSAASSSAASSTTASRTSTSASAATTTSAASTSTTARPSSSSTTTSGTTNSTTSTTSGTARPSTSVVNTNNSNKMYGSSLALVVVSVAAFAFFN